MRWLFVPYFYIPYYSIFVKYRIIRYIKKQLTKNASGTVPKNASVWDLTAQSQKRGEKMHKVFSIPNSLPELNEGEH